METDARAPCEPDSNNQPDIPVSLSIAQSALGKNSHLDKEYTWSSLLSADKSQAYKAAQLENLWGSDVLHDMGHHADRSMFLVSVK